MTTEYSICNSATYKGKRRLKSCARFEGVARRQAHERQVQLVERAEVSPKRKCVSNDRKFRTLELSNNKVVLAVLTTKSRGKKNELFYRRDLRGLS